MYKFVVNNNIFFSFHDHKNGTNCLMPHHLLVDSMHHLEGKKKSKQF